MEELVNFQEDLYGRLLKAQSNYKKTPKERMSKEYFEGRIETVEQLWFEFLAGHKEIMRSQKSSVIKSSSYTQNDLYDKCDELVLEYKTELKTKLTQFNVPNKSSDQGGKVERSKTNVKLPKVNINSFSGKCYSEWTTFRDLFRSLIHQNIDLDDVQKLLYLKGYVTGEAEQLLSNIPIAQDNYKRAWELLEDRYDNKKYISHQILERLLNQRSVTQESASKLKDILDTTNDCLAALTNVGVKSENWDILVIHIVIKKLDPESRRQWEFSAVHDNSTLPTYSQFQDFLTKRYRALEFLDPGSSPTHKKEGHTNNNWSVKKTKSMHVAKIQCSYCSEGHTLAYCAAFKKVSVDIRRDFVQSNRICFCCLVSNHTANTCKKNINCHLCGRRHHTLLHQASEKEHDVGQGPAGSTTGSHLSHSAASTSSSDNNQDGKPNALLTTESIPVVSCFSRKPNPTLLATALVKSETQNGQWLTFRALLDQGSQSSFITEAMVQQLGLKKTPTKVQITGLGGDKALVSKAIVNLKVSSRIDPGVVINVKAHVLTSITTLLPTNDLKSIVWTEFKDIVLADPGYHTPNRVDMLLGAEVYGEILQDGVRKGPQGSPVAQCTSLGWILSGALNPTDESSEIKVMHVMEDDSLLKRFWELEDDVPMSKQKLLTEQEKQCEDFFSKSTVRDEDGRYVVRLPKRSEEDPVVENSLKIAEKRLFALEKRLKSGNLKQKYKEVINEYIDLNHMELVPTEEINNPKAIYLPHHAVVREDKQTTKVRAVFDASCKGTNNKSLNDQLLIGPSLQADLRHLVMRWRVSRICLTADIEKMYRQIRVNEADVNFQRILWRNDITEEIKHYRMLRVTFGVASAPYLAVKALQQLSVDEGEKYPAAAKAVLNQFYMDDLLAGCENVEQGLKLYKELNALVEKGGFSLQKWTSSSEELLQKIKKNENNGKEEEEESLKIKTDEVMKIVGLTWNRSDDSFRYKVDAPEVIEPATKRTIISEICRFYDPLGWVAPSIIVSKILIQKLWLAGLDWDERVPENILNEWKKYKKELKMLTHVKIPRWIGVVAGDVVELHGFSDASKDAYAAVVYSRIIDSMGQIHVSLISAKTKVAPIKQVSIPRLELCGAVLLTRLMIEIADVMNIDKRQLHAWTDSTVVLAWLNSHPSRWKVFVANRVSEVLLSLDTHHWAHVSTKCNPADVASRGQSPSELVGNELWFQGPEFLQKRDIDYKKPKENDTNVEQATTKSHCATMNSSVLERFSSLTRMIRVIAYCKRFICNLKIKGLEKKVGFLTSQELNDALNQSIKLSQTETFKEEIGIVRRKENLPKRSSLRALNPFLDNDDILRVGGRLELSNLKANRKHPILLSKEAYLSNLLVSDAHKQTLHGGPQLMLCYLRNKYWILGAAQMVKSCFRKCVTCVKNTGRTEHQLMGQLPSTRSTPARPFKTSGVDFAGPIQIRTAKGRGQKSHKGYICLFVCMVTRAVHLDVVTDLTTEGFLQAFKRFVSRRGYCTEIWSDNGTNFAGAANEIKRLFSNEKGSMVQEIAESLATNGCTWKFIPARSPHFGGIWEGGVKSVKYHLRRVIGESTLTFEEMSTVLSQIEACLNSRPLSVIAGVDDENSTILTPGHFLVGEAIVTAPDRNFEDSNVNSLRRWQYTQRMVQDFWRQWSQQHLTKFYKRYRWANTMPQPRIDDVVVVREENLPPCRWLYGRVIATHPGQDNLVRVVTLKVKNGTIKRPLSKLCLLPIAI